MKQWRQLGLRLFLPSLHRPTTSSPLLPSPLSFPNSTKTSSRRINMEMNYYNQVMAISTITSQLSGTAVHTFPLASALSSFPPSSSPPFRSPSQQQQQYWKDNHIHASNNIFGCKSRVDAETIPWRMYHGACMYCCI
uniref:Uncharacterized protein n=1 Tax=Helicotheca tamesis TaxID=374047 RepID=A0A7S2HZQ9_9STRA|mmetsp:Transcript_415/g.520  ORF Transcript_415/g.520 Transcript_415/m.520 type:complete len:137 (+) Transcript_415:243-653(+)